ncbi:MAG: helix-turn-helix transcriptional regulator [Clostridia bacterium]|nr:helix-turn-helix transcriptional regulator [Clostridia bacterium]
MKFKERLKELRIENGYTQKQIATLLEISTTCFSGYEQGYREPDLTMLIKICKVLGVSADYLLGLTD